MATENLETPKEPKEKSQKGYLKNPTLKEYRSNTIVLNNSISPLNAEFTQTTTTEITDIHVPAVDANYPFQHSSATGKIDTAKIEQYLRQLQSQQSMILGFVGGLAAAIVSAIIWAGITVATDYQIGWMAVGVGFFVGFAVRALGKGLDNRYGYLGAGLSLLGCLLGNFLAIVIVVARMQSANILTTLSFFIAAPAAIVETMKATFSPIDLLFYGLAVYEGYRFSFRRITREEVTISVK